MGLVSPKVDLYNILGEFGTNSFRVWRVIKLDLDKDYVMLENTVTGKRIERKASNKNIEYRSI